MDKNYLIQLTNNLYRLTLLFPKKEPLRYKMRELADDILADFIIFSEKNSEKGNSTEIESLLIDLEKIGAFFELAKNQNWVDSSELLATQKDYDILKGELEEKQSEIKKRFSEESFEEDRKIKHLKAVTVSKNEALAHILSERQEKIISFLKENGRAQVWEIKQILPEVSKRTLRRDFENMLGQGIIERIGERNYTFYQLKRMDA